MMDLRRVPCPKCGKKRLMKSIVKPGLWCRSCHQYCTWQEVKQAQEGKEP